MPSQLTLFGLVLALMTTALLIRLRSVRGLCPDERGQWARQVVVTSYPNALKYGGGLVSLVGILMWLHGSVESSRRIELEEVEAGAAVSASFVEFEGYGHGASAVCRDGKVGRTCYTPVASDPERDVAAVVVVDGRAHFGVGAYGGLVFPDGPFGLHSEFARRGIRLGAGAVFVHHGETPEEQRIAGLGVAAMGLVLSVTGMLWLRRMHAKRR